MSYWVYVSGAMIMWGLWGFLPMLASQHMGYKDATVWEWIGMLAVALPCLIMVRGRPSTGDGGACWYAMATGLCGLAGALLYYKAMAASGDYSANVIMVSALYPVISIALAFAILGQTINAGQAVGIILCLTGSLVIAKFS